MGKHGGKRKGAGRKKVEPTVILRIPTSLVSEVKALVNKHKATQPKQTTGKKTSVKYRWVNVCGEVEEWSGRGRTPAFLQVHEMNGGSREVYRV